MCSINDQTQTHRLYGAMRYRRDAIYQHAARRCGDTCTSRAYIARSTRAVGLGRSSTGWQTPTSAVACSRGLCHARNTSLVQEPLPLMQFRIEPRRGSLATTTAPALLSACLPTCLPTSYIFLLCHLPSTAGQGDTSPHTDPPTSAKMSAPAPDPSTVNATDFGSFINGNAGAALHETGGWNALWAAMSFALATAGIQMLVFVLLRWRLTRIYRPRTYLVPERERVAIPPHGIIGWIKPVFSTPSLQLIQKCGLDAYFFIRYLRMPTTIAVRV